MIKKVLMICALCIASISFAQKAQQHDPRLLERYSVQELDIMKTNSPKEYRILNKALKVGVSIGPIPKAKGKDVHFDGVLEADLSQPQTYISLGVKLINRYQYFKIEGTNKMVIVRPKNKILDIHQVK